MKRRFSAIALLVSLVFSQTISAFADGLDNVGTEIVSETANSDTNLSASVSSGSDEGLIAETDEDYFDAIYEDSEDTESIPETSKMEYESSVDIENVCPGVSNSSSAEEMELFNAGECIIEPEAIDDIEGIEPSEEVGFVDDVVPLAAEKPSVSSASNISLNTYHSGTLSDYSSENWYKFTISSAGYISLSFTHDYIESNGSYWEARLYNSDQVRLTSYSFAGSKTSYTQGNVGVPAGIYYLRITHGTYFSAGIGYNVRINYTSSNVWETEFNDSYDTGNTINVNNVYYGSLCSYDDVDWYKFTVSSAGYISLGFVHDYIESSGGYWKAYLYNSGMIGLAVYSFSGSITSYRQGNIGVPAGTYYIKITNSTYAPTGYGYNIKINYSSSNAWEKEFNDSYNTGNPINVNKDFYGSLCSSDDVDWYQFTLSNAGYISLSFEHDYIESSGGYWKAYLYNSGQVWLTSYSFAGSKTSYAQGNIGLPAGTYYLKIQHDTYYSGYDYNIKINYSPSNVWETEFNDSYGTCNSVKENTVYYGSLCSNDDVDWYKFVLPSGGMQILSFNHGYVSSEGSYWRLYLYNSLMSELCNYSYSGSTTRYSHNLNLSAGTYYIKITHGTYCSTVYDYNFKISSHTHNFTNKVTKATLSKDGKIEKTCSCGATNGTTIIHYPQTIYLSASEYTYDGKSKKPTMIVKGSDGKAISSSNYTLNYSGGRKNVGTYKVTIKFKGNYSGTVSKTFDIFPKATSISKLTAKSKGFSVKWKKRTKQVTGYQIQYSTSLSFYSSVTKTITKNTISSATYKGLSSKGKYYVRVRTYKKVSGMKYYSLWSNIKTVTTKK